MLRNAVDNFRQRNFGQFLCQRDGKGTEPFAIFIYFVCIHGKMSESRSYCDLFVYGTKQRMPSEEGCRKIFTRLCKPDILHCVICAKLVN